jgi:hypothetical protein
MDITSGQAQALYVGEYVQSYVAASPDHRFIASIQAKGRGNLFKNNLIILDYDGNVLHEINSDVREVSWSPDGNKVAYITGTYAEVGRGFDPTGSWIFSLESESTEEIGLLTAYDIKWAQFDNRIYLEGYQTNDDGYDYGVFCYDPSSRNLYKTDYHGINFSSTGKYYIALFGEIRLSKVFERVTNREIKLRGIDIGRQWYRWAGNDILLVIGIDTTEAAGWPKTRIWYTYLYSLENHNILVRTAGTPIFSFETDGIRKLVMEGETYSILSGERVRSLPNKVMIH